MTHSKILGTVLILGSGAIAISPVVANPTQTVDFAPNFYTRQSTQSKHVDFTLQIARNQTFAELMQKAELTATSLTQQAFTENSGLREVSVRIFGERNGQEAPLLFAKVSRPEWQKQPRIQNWSQYFTSSGVLLGLVGTEQPSASRSTTPTFRSPNPPAATPPASSPPSLSAPPVPIPTPPAVRPSGNSSTTPPPPNNLPSGNLRPGGASLEEGDPGYR